MILYDNSKRINTFNTSIKNMLMMKKPLEFTGEFVIFDVGDDEGVHPQSVGLWTKKGGSKRVAIIYIINKKSAQLSQATHSKDMLRKKQIFIFYILLLDYFP